MFIEYKGIPVSFVYPIVKAIVLQGFNQDEFLAMADLDKLMLQNPELRLSVDKYVQLIEIAASLTRDEHFGLHQGQSLEASDLGILGYVMMHSTTIEKAILAYQKYNAILCTGFNIAQEIIGDKLWIRIYSVNPYQVFSHHCMEDVTSSLYHLMVKMSCRPIPLRGVLFAHQSSAQLEEYIKVFGIMPKFGQKDSGLLLNREILNYPILFADSNLHNMFIQMADDTLHRLIQGKKYADQLYNWVMHWLPQAYPSVSEAAQHFQMSVRTIQTKLKQENTTFKEIVSHARMELAISLLAQPEHSIGEIAYLLHFSEPSSFQNAFKKWTGETPGQYRAGLISTAGLE